MKYLIISLLIFCGGCTPTTTSKIYSYEIINKESDQMYNPYWNKMEKYVLISIALTSIDTAITKEDLVDILEDCYKQQNDAFQYVNHYDDINIFLFASKELASSGYNKFICKRLSRNNGIYGFDEDEFNRIKTIHISQEKFGLTELQRKIIWAQLCLLEDQTDVNKARDIVTRKFNLKDEELSQISEEAMNNNWVFPN